MWAVLAIVLIGSPLFAEAKTEKDKIEALIARVEQLKDAKFVRNGVEYDAKSAAAFLRGKWDARKDSIKTAKEFIDKIASVSSTTGKPYLIRIKERPEVKSRDYLHAELKRLETPSVPKSFVPG